MFEFDPQRFRIEDLDRIARQSGDALQALTEAMAELEETTGEGEAADGMIWVSLDSTGAATEVHLDPRALRLGSEAIAEGMLEAFNAAQADLREKSRRLVSEALPEGFAEHADDAADPEEVRGRFDEILASFGQAMAERQAAFDRIARDVEDPD